MGPRAYLDDVVRPNFAEIDPSKPSMRLVLNAVASVDALAAHIFHWCKRNAPHEVSGIDDDSAFREKKLAQADPDFRLLRDIAKAQKHVILDRGKPTVSSAHQVSERPLGYGQGRWGEGTWGGTPQIVVETDNGEFRSVDYLLKAGLSRLESEMKRLGI